ncbi:MFS transporter [Marinomonas sp. PE14-40]|uniref:MFS transporter n=1 Tax=Marinomonas sp. PE14-40 TaxID=3060621 RepID=UPI003F681F41
MQHSSSTQTQDVKHSIWMMLGLSLSVLVASLATSMINVALPNLTLAFHSNMQQVQWIVAAYLLVITSLIVSLGRLGDILGNRRLLLIGILIFTVSSLAGAMANNLMFLIITRVFQGLGAAIILALSMALMSKSQAKAGRAMGLWGSVSAMGTALGPAIGGISLSLYGWQSLFLIIVPFSIIAFFLLYLALPSDPQVKTAVSEKEARSLPEENGLPNTKKKGKFDLLGNLILAISLSAFALSMSLETSQFKDLHERLNVGLFVLALIGIWGFFNIEKRQERKHITPLIPSHIFNNRNFKISFICCAITASIVMTCLVIGPYYLSITLALSAYQVGLVMSTGPLVVVLSGVPAGRLSDKVGAKNMLLIGLCLMTLGCLLMSFNHQATGVIGYIFALVTITLGFSLFQVANSADVMSKTNPQTKGVTSALLNLARNLGFMTGAAFMGSIFFRFIGSQQLLLASSDEVTYALHNTFLIAALFVFIGISFTLYSRVKPLIN